jgi:hypothetical protein
MPKISRNISILEEYNCTTWYTHTCSCGCGEQVTMEVVAHNDVELVTLEFYVEVKSFNMQCKSNCFLQFISDALWRVKNGFKVLLMGQISLQTEICINSKQGIDDYIKALTEASVAFKEEV